MKHNRVWWTLGIALAVVLVGCRSAEPTAAPDAGAAYPQPGTGAMGSLVGVNGLALGTLRLEDTEDAVTPQQAVELLPLWQMIGSGSLQGDAETQAVLKQIEGAMTESQRAAIDGMGSTSNDMQAWMEGQGIEMPARPEAGPGGGGAFQNMSEDERARMREQFQNMSAEERATRMAELGLQRPGGQEVDPNAMPNRGGVRQPNVLLGPLIELLKERAAQ
jgi:hypothetical protein